VIAQSSDIKDDWWYRFCIFRLLQRLNLQKLNYLSNHCVQPYLFGSFFEIVAGILASTI